MLEQVVGGFAAEGEDVSGSTLEEGDFFGGEGVVPVVGPVGVGRGVVDGVGGVDEALALDEPGRVGAGGAWDAAHFGVCDDGVHKTLCGGWLKAAALMTDTGQALICSQLSLLPCCQPWIRCLSLPTQPYLMLAASAMVWASGQVTPWELALKPAQTVR